MSVGQKHGRSVCWSVAPTHPHVIDDVYTALFVSQLVKIPAGTSWRVDNLEGSDRTVGSDGDKSQQWIMRSIVVVDVVDVVNVVVVVVLCVCVCVYVCVFTCVRLRFGPSMFLFSGCVCI